MLDNLHQTWVAPRRINTISEKILSWVSKDSSIVDVGCGDGQIAELLRRSDKNLKVQGLEVSVRGSSHIPVSWFDGNHIPMPDQSIDVVLLIDVIHHAQEQLQLLAEAARVAREAIIIKDHLLHGYLGSLTLSFMDFVGNQRSEFKRPSRYLRQEQWDSILKNASFRIDQWETKLNLYSWPANILFERNFHFMARLVRN